MADPKALYQEVILDHNRKPRNYGTLADASHHADGHNPLCGDHITLALRLDDGKVGAIAFEGESCAICKASASMLTTNVKGKTRDEAEVLIREFRDMADLNAQAQRDKTLIVDIGLPVKKQQIYDTYGFEAPGPKDEVIGTGSPSAARRRGSRRSDGACLRG